MQRLEVSCAVRLIYTSLGAKGLSVRVQCFLHDSHRWWWSFCYQQTVSLLLLCYWHSLNSDVSYLHGLYTFCTYVLKYVALLKCCVKPEYVPPPPTPQLGSDYFVNKIVIMSGHKFKRPSSEWGADRISWWVQSTVLREGGGESFWRSRVRLTLNCVISQILVSKRKRWR